MGAQSEKGPRKLILVGNKQYLRVVKTLGRGPRGTARVEASGTPEGLAWCFGDSRLLFKN